jgi:hypothetical protein
MTWNVSDKKLHYNYHLKEPYFYQVLSIFIKKMQFHITLSVLLLGTKAFILLCWMFMNLFYIHEYKTKCFFTHFLDSPQCSTDSGKCFILQRICGFDKVENRFNWWVNSNLLIYLEESTSTEFHGYIYANKI